MTKDQRLSTAIHIISALAFKAPQGLSSEQLALSLKGNSSYVRRILAQLSRAGLIKSFKGPQGGYRLKKEASNISIKDVYLALGSARLFKSFEKHPFKHCPISCGIKQALDALYYELDQSLLVKMGSISIKKFASKI